MDFNRSRRYIDIESTPYMYCECLRRIPENYQPSIKTGLFGAKARRNMDTRPRVAMVECETSGVDATVREIADRAGVCVETLYRHFPQLLAPDHRSPRNSYRCLCGGGRRLQKIRPERLWSIEQRRLVDFIATKAGFVGALHSGDAWAAPSSLANDRLDLKMGHAQSIISE